MRGLGLGLGLAAPNLGGGGGQPAPTALPALANLVARWSPDDAAMINGGTPANGDLVSSFADSVSGIVLQQATAAAKPTYKTGGLGGKPYLKIDGGDALGVVADPKIAVALTAATGTVMVFFRNLVATSFGHLIKWGASNNNSLFAGSTSGGSYTPAGVANGAGIPGRGFDGTSFVGSVALSSIMLSQNYQNSYSPMAFNGTCINPAPGSAAASNGDFSIGNAVTPSIGANCEIYDVLIWNRPLNYVEQFQAHKWGCEKYGQLLPSVILGKLDVYRGDSQTFGAGATIANDAYPSQVARQLGRPYGTFVNAGESSMTTATLAARDPTELDPIIALAGVPCRMVFLEYYNNFNAGLTGAQAATANLGFATARKAAGYAKVAMFTCCDSKEHFSARTQYLANMNAGYMAAGIDVLLPIDGNANIGVVNSCPNAPGPYGAYFADGIHFTTAGYTEIANVAAPVVSSWA